MWPSITNTDDVSKTGDHCVIINLFMAETEHTHIFQVSRFFFSYLI